MDPNKTFTLGRTVDKNYRPNQIIIALFLLSIIGGIGGFVYQGTDFIDAVIFGLLFGLTIFLTWVIGREFIPQAEYAAIGAAAVAIAAIAWVGFFPIVLLILFWIVMILRFINQTTGIESSIIDHVLVLFLSIVIGLILSWVFLIITFIAYIAEYMISKRKYAISFAIVTASVLVLLFIMQRIWYNQEPLSFLNGFLSLIIVLLFGVCMFGIRNVQVVCDQSPTMVPKKRILAAQLLGLLSVFLIVGWFGNVYMTIIMPIWAVLVTGIVFTPITYVLDKRKNKKSG